MHETYSFSVMIIDMILNTGQRTDIPAFYAEWFANRIREGYVMARNPYYPKIVYKYDLDPSLIDVICFCSKNPEPIFPYMDLLKPYMQIWHVTITPYGHDIEPRVPDKWHVMDVFRKLSLIAGRKRIFWRYDPIFINERYPLEYHMRAFEKMCTYLDGYTDHVIISFIDLYEKTRKNFPSVKEVSEEDIQTLGKFMQETALKHHMKLMTCLEDHDLSKYGIDTKGCMRQDIVEEALGVSMHVPAGHDSREGCHCLLGNDIGAYNTCMHGCLYCYANYDQKTVMDNCYKHDPSSPLLIGNLKKDDEIHEAVQKTWLSRQMMLNLQEE